MEPLQLVSIVVALVVLVGLLWLHKVVVQTYVVPELEPAEDTDE